MRDRKAPIHRAAVHCEPPAELGRLIADEMLSELPPRLLDLLIVAASAPSPTLDDLASVWEHRDVRAVQRDVVTHLAPLVHSDEAGRVHVHPLIREALDEHYAPFVRPLLRRLRRAAWRAAITSGARNFS